MIAQLMDRKSDEASRNAAQEPEQSSNRIALEDIESPILLQGVAYWRDLSGERNFPARADVTPRGLASLLRNTALLRVIDGGKDYEYRIVGDAYVMAHGVSFQGKRWSETGKLSPGYHALIKAVYDRVVRKAEPIAMRGWIERGAESSELVHCEYVFLPLGMDGKTVDHILVFAVYLPREKRYKTS
ncbi:MAG: PAS domain-containing protein [Alphaproteobacteria bacterium]|nr:PAS domain-containing protein [Alphaproteobacteria bacterium]